MSVTVAVVLFPGMVTVAVSRTVMVSGGSVMIVPDMVVVDPGRMLVLIDSTVTVVGGNVTVVGTGDGVTSVRVSSTGTRLA